MEDTGYRLSIHRTDITPEMHLFAPEEQYVYSNCSSATCSAYGNYPIKYLIFIWSAERPCYQVCDRRSISCSVPLKSPIKRTLVISGNPTVNGNG